VGAHSPSGYSSVASRLLPPAPHALLPVKRGMAFEMELVPAP